MYNRHIEMTDSIRARGSQDTADMKVVIVVEATMISKTNVPLAGLQGEVIEVADGATAVAGGMTVIGTEIETGVLILEKGIVDREVL